MTENAILLDRQGHVATVTIDRADKMNAIDAVMTRRLIAIFGQLAGEQDIRAVVLRGSGRHFSAGGDMSTIAAMIDPDAQKRSDAMREGVSTLSKPLALAFEALPQPVVASVRGHVIGLALQLVLMSDLVVASQTAGFTLPQLRLGHTPDHGESLSLVRRIGLSRALQMSLTAERVDAATAADYGLANWAVSDEELDGFTDALVARLAASPPAAARAAKALFRGSAGRTLAETLDAEIEAAAGVAAQEDFAEAITAFMDKREPRFTGR